MRTLDTEVQKSFDADTSVCIPSQEAQGYVSLVGTPIGNLQDVSARVIATLQSSNLILCEDTRVTSKLLHYFDIRVACMRADAHTIASRIDEVHARVARGEHVSFVSDAGMPGISDPGQVLADAMLEAHIKLEVVPGPSACVCALAAAGLEMDKFFFEGFLPRKSSSQQERLRLLSIIPASIVIYESPRRVLDTLEAIASVLPDRRCALVRELTKIHEEVFRGYPQDLLAELTGRFVAPDGSCTLKGECVLVIECAPACARALEAELMRTTQEEYAYPSIEEAIDRGLASHEKPTQLAKRLAKMYQLSKNDVYNMVVVRDQAH